MSKRNLAIFGSRRHTFVAVAGFLAVAAVVAAPAQASVTYTVNTNFNGTSPTSTPPWLTADFTNGGANTVILTLTSGLDVASEFISDVDFNVNPAIVPSSLTIVQSPLVNPLATITNTTQNAQNLVGAGAAGFGFDVNLAWTTANNAGRFNGSDVVSFTITGTGLTESDFAFTNTGSAAAHIAAHFQGIPDDDGTTSGAAKDGPSEVIPEPATIVIWSLIGTLAIGIGWWRRPRRS